MTNYQTNIAGKPELNTLVMNGNNEFVFNEKIHSLEYKMLDKSIILLRINDKNYTIEYELNDEEKENNEFTFNIDSHKITMVCKNELDVLVDKIAGGKKEKKQKNDITSPMPGVILKVKVKEGDELKKGDVILVLEAMKMENEIKATRDCKIKKINVEEKKSVNKNELLVILE
ncbi:MAG: acetyl-CoA carboxylase biotin carboxyl carrier protein subunit [Ignavibacteria bacterium]|nr:acetyl-CoA carboxylase biotin carboxyl carrier protein subunit [Ignavibacteria bacterium]